MYRPFKQMLKSLLLGGATGIFLLTPAIAQQQETPQPNDPALKIYRGTTTRVNDLVNTKLDVRFDYPKRYLYGKAWITLKPHFYATDSLTLDAKGMEIKQIAIAKNGKNTPLKYDYNGFQLDIKLDKSYKRTESYIIYVEYTAR